MWKHLSNLNEPFPVTNKSWNKNEQEFNPLSIQIQHKFFLKVKYTIALKFISFHSQNLPDYY